jgi:hypothetical protein
MRLSQIVGERLLKVVSVVRVDVLALHIGDITNLEIRHGLITFLDEGHGQTSLTLDCRSGVYVELRGVESYPVFRENILQFFAKTVRCREREVIADEHFE